MQTYVYAYVHPHVPQLGSRCLQGFSASRLSKPWPSQAEGRSGRNVCGGREPGLQDLQSPAVNFKGLGRLSRMSRVTIPENPKREPTYLHTRGRELAHIQGWIRAIFFNLKAGLRRQGASGSAYNRPSRGKSYCPRREI